MRLRGLYPAIQAEEDVLFSERVFDKLCSWVFELRLVGGIIFLIN